MKWSSQMGKSRAITFDNEFKITVHWIQNYNLILERLGYLLLILSLINHLKSLNIHSFYSFSHFFFHSCCCLLHFDKNCLFLFVFNNHISHPVVYRVYSRVKFLFLTSSIKSGLLRGFFLIFDVLFFLFLMVVKLF